MRFPSWSYFRISILAVINTCLVTILLHPWLQLAASYWHFSLLAGAVWVFTIGLAGIFAALKATGSGIEAIFPLVLLLLGGLALGLLWHLPLFFFLPLGLLLLILASRFTGYSHRKKFAADWALGSLLLVVFASLENYVGFTVDLGQMLAFFALGLGAVILWNTVFLEQAGLSPDYRGLSRSITFFILAVGGLALGLAVLLSPDFLAAVMSLAAKIYGLFADAIVFLIVRPFAWLLSPLFRWADSFESKEVPLELPETERVPLERGEVETALDPAAVKALGIGGWVLVVAALLLAAWIIYRRLRRQEKEEQETTLTESRESVFSRSEFVQDLKGVLETLVKPLTRLRPTRWYSGDDPLLTIRTLYAKFVVKNRRRAGFSPELTPQEYAEKLAEREEINQAAVGSLTKFYNAARYGGQADEEAVKRSEQAFREL